MEAFYITSRFQKLGLHFLVIIVKYNVFMCTIIRLYQKQRLAWLSTVSHQPMLILLIFFFWHSITKKTSSPAVDVVHTVIILEASSLFDCCCWIFFFLCVCRHGYERGLYYSHLSTYNGITLCLQHFFFQ